MSLIYLASVPYVNEFCDYMETTLTQNTQEDLTERNIGNTLAFPLPENDAIRVFGMPRNVLMDVSQFHASSLQIRIFFLVSYSLESRISRA